MNPKPRENENAGLSDTFSGEGDAGLCDSFSGGGVLCFIFPSQNLPSSHLLSIDLGLSLLAVPF